MQLFYHKDISQEKTLISLSTQESQHAAKVLRKQVGDTLYVCNGFGQIFKTTIVSINKKNCSVQVLEIHLDETAKSENLSIAIAPTKNISRIEWFIEKAVEIGVKNIYLFVSQNAERRVAKEDRLQLKARSAMKQSLKTHLPKIVAIQKFENCIQSLSKDYENKYIAYCKTDALHFKETIKDKTNTILFIGPEGGFAEKEIAFAEKHDFKAVTLGKSRLRTETAAIFAVSIFNALNT